MNLILNKKDIPHGLEKYFKPVKKKIQHPHSYLSHTKLWMQEAIRVLKDDGIIFVNIADSYNGSGGQGNQHKQAKVFGNFNPHKVKDYPIKSKCLIPERFGIMCVDELGLILRNHIVWAKPNGMPESVTDRFSKKWESVFMFTKKPDYYFDLDGVKNKYQQTTIERCQRNFQSDDKIYSGNFDSKKHGEYGKKVLSGALNGTNPGDVWSIPTSPSSEKHFAMWPEKLVERMILCSTKPGDIVLDCFAGSLTTGRVAIRLQRQFVGIELGYKDMAVRRSKNIQINLLT